jgi:hypothetical protein
MTPHLHRSPEERAARIDRLRAAALAVNAGRSILPAFGPLGELSARDEARAERTERQAVARDYQQED